MHVIALRYRIHQTSAFGTYFKMDVEKGYLIEGELNQLIPELIEKTKIAKLINFAITN